MAETGIIQKMFEIQSRQLSVTKDAKNPHFKNSYATLNEVYETLLPVLNELSVLLTRITTETSFGIRFTCLEDGSFIESFLPYTDSSKVSAQSMGGTVTYYTRYLTVAMCNLPCVDDDGNTAANLPQAPTGNTTNFSF